MAGIINIGGQSFEELRKRQCFYIDKTKFIKEWWEAEDDITLITRPRRFGKTLNLSMLECFFSNRYAGRSDLFEGLSIWEEEKYHKIQGIYPTINLSFAKVKEVTYQKCYRQICSILEREYDKQDYLLNSAHLNENQKHLFSETRQLLHERADDERISDSLNLLCYLLHADTGKKPLIFLDEYDTPMQEAYVNGFWDSLVLFLRSLFNASFKTNPSLGRALMTGITRISKESIFSDLNNLEIITTTSDFYASAFGFTQQEVFTAMEEQGLSAQKDDVKLWYDGFTFGKITDIYNPWSIINYFKKRKFDTYWANTSANSLIKYQLQQADEGIKKQLEILLQDGVLQIDIDEEIVFHQLSRNPNAIWSLMLASGYLKIVDLKPMTQEDNYERYTVGVTNLEVKKMLRAMVHEWFAVVSQNYNYFLKSLILGDVEAMNDYMNEIAMEIFSNFDTGKKSSGKSQPERFYHGFVLGLVVDLADRYEIRSNRESGFGRYDVMLVPREKTGVGIIIEFKVFHSQKEKSLEDTAVSALKQIEEKQYARELEARGILPQQIHVYGFAFEGKRVLIAGK